MAELRIATSGAVKAVGVGSLEKRETAARGRATMPSRERSLSSARVRQQDQASECSGVKSPSRLSFFISFHLFVSSSRPAHSKVPFEMRYRLPLELELMILQLAAPPLAFDRLHDRVDFFINVSLVHRSFTA